MTTEVELSEFAQEEKKQRMDEGEEEEGDGEGEGEGNVVRDTYESDVVIDCDTSKDPLLEDERKEEGKMKTLSEDDVDNGLPADTYSRMPPTQISTLFIRTKVASHFSFRILSHTTYLPSSSNRRHPSPPHPPRQG